MKFKVGDRIRSISCNKVGTIVGMSETGVFDHYRVKLDGDTFSTYYLLEEDVELEEVKKYNMKFKIGDRVRYTGDSCNDTGTIVKVDDDVVVVKYDKSGQELASYDDTLELIGEGQANDNVNHPSHYTSDPSGVECIEITKHRDFCIGNAIKYLWRCGLKQDADKTPKEKEIEDMRKAVWYINTKIAMLENTK